MSIELKIHQGTGRLTGTSLCRSCCESHVMRDRGGERVLCTANRQEFRVAEPVTECSAYRNKSLPSLYDMREIAWELKTNKQGKTMGFSPPKKGGDD